MRAKARPIGNATRTAGAIIALARKQAGMTQANVGAMLRPPISYAAVSDIERGRTHIDIELACQLIAILLPQDGPSGEQSTDT